MEIKNTQFRRYTVTSALPYANGPIHIGHLAGVYVPADIYVRYLRLKGEEVVFIGGSDEHGVPITIKARQQGVSPQEVVDKFHNIIKQSFEEFGISFDVYSRTSAPIHHQTAADFFSKLFEKGVFVEQSSQQYFDTEAGQFLADRYITGTCPHCSFEKAYGDQCERCGTTLSPLDLINPRSALSGNTPVLKETKHWYLPLDKAEPWLREWILEGHKDDWKPNVYGQCKSWIDQGLQPRAVTRDLDWGVKVPLPNTEGKVLYVWFDAPIGYISATREWAEAKGIDWEPWWKNQDTKLVHFIGKDNIVFHCIIFPFMLRSEGSYILPDNVPANEFLNLENEKISTSRNWAVWLHEYLLDFPGRQDELRYVLTSNAPETKDSDFTWKDFQARNNNELLAIYGNFVNRTLVLTQKYFGSAVPKPTILNQADHELLATIKSAADRIGQSIENYRFREALNELMNLARSGNKYLTDNEPWKLIKTNPERVQTILYVSLQVVAGLMLLSEPFLPFSSARLSAMIRLKLNRWHEAKADVLLPAGKQLGEPGYLFEKIEDAAIEAQINKLLETRKVNEQQAAPDVRPSKDMISYDEFTRMDIRTAVIEEAENVAKAKKLLKLTVNTGIDRRTIVSGIAEHYKPEDIVGKKVVMLVNLEPREIRGIMSQGMILMAENNLGKLCFVSPTEDFHPGSEVK
jgi:methionyl-tRNA synthetase